MLLLLVCWLGLVSAGLFTGSLANHVLDLQEPTDYVTDVVLESKKFTMIVWYASWCPHCQHFAPIFSKVASQLEGDERVTFLVTHKSTGIMYSNRSRRRSSRSSSRSRSSSSSAKVIVVIGNADGGGVVKLCRSRDYSQIVSLSSFSIFSIVRVPMSASSPGGGLSSAQRCV